MFISGRELTLCRRNPLTAILQLADGISQSMKGQSEESADYKGLVQANIESANTILACAAHQKRIIDDVLILSRLESDMLSFTPIPTSPSSVVHSTLRKSYEGESPSISARRKTLREANLLTFPTNHRHYSGEP